MSFIEKHCTHCANLFRASLKEHNRGNARFCSLVCSGKHHSETRAKKVIPNVSCAYCDKMFYKNTSKMKCSKSGIYFCQRSCKDAAQRIGGIEAIMPSHYGTGNGISGYRKLAFEHYPKKCDVCSYDKFVGILEVHHRDYDRTNNKVENLQVLCPTCHDTLHFITSSGKWGLGGIHCDEPS